MDRHLFENLIAKGCSQREIGDTLNISQTTVRYWLGRHALKTTHNRHSKVVYDGKYIERECKHHGNTTWIFEKSKNGYRCKKCRSGNVAKQRKELKARLVRESGGRCVNCGYNKSLWSLEFHHRDAATKDREVGHLIRDRKYEAAKAEVDKCDLVCSNCHGELEEAKWKATVV